jgi:gluconate 2-dehydrogenase gamma chain
MISCPVAQLIEATSDAHTSTKCVINFQSVAATQTAAIGDKNLTFSEPLSQIWRALTILAARLCNDAESHRNLAPRSSDRIRGVDLPVDDNCLKKVSAMGSRFEEKNIKPEVQPSHSVSRRDLLAGTAATIACAFVPASSLRFAQIPSTANVLTLKERQTLEAIVSRIIPADANGPGALESGCAHYIESALEDAYRSLKDAYAAGLAALDSYSISNGGKSFATSNVNQQDKFLSDFEHNTKVGDYHDGAAFFEMVRRHTLEGMFGDPSYGGNADFAGWELIGYPGPRMYVGPQMQTMDAKIPHSKVSAKELVHGSR